MGYVVGNLGRAQQCVAIGALLGTFACTAMVDGTSPMGAGASGGDPFNPQAGSSGAGGSAGSSVTPPTDPGRGAMHRLNSNEYNYTVADVLGTSLHPAGENWRGGELDGFDNIASQLGTTDTQFGLYLDAAEALARDFFASPTLKSRFLTCGTADAACAKEFASNAGLRLFRRPLRATELARYEQLYTSIRGQGQDHEASLEHLLWAMLSSAEFLYRIELRGSAPGNRPLNSYELASRISYFLWNSAPDDALLDAAKSDSLQSDDGVKATFERVLNDGKSNRFIESFIGQWLGARKVASHAVAPALYPAWSPDSAQAATNEMYFYFSEFLHSDRPWTDFLKADVNFVNESLAPIYGITGITGANLQRVEHTTDERAGFMGLAGFLTLSSTDRRTSPTSRGKWVLQRILCTDPPPPKPGIPELSETGRDLDKGNIRDALAQHRKDPDCKLCHALFDPFGLALEHYDAIGHYRETYADGSAIDASTELGASAAYPNGIKFDGIRGGADAVTGSPQFKACVVKKLYTYGLGRLPSGEEAGWLPVIQRDWETGTPSVPKLIQSIVLSKPFRNSGDAP
jgi:hypothetical protein